VVSVCRISLSFWLSGGEADRLCCLDDDAERSMATGGELSEAASSGVEFFVSDWWTCCIVGLVVSDSIVLCRINIVSVPLSGKSLLGFFTTSFSLRLSDLSASVGVVVVVASSALIWSVTLLLLDNMSPKYWCWYILLLFCWFITYGLGFEVLDERLAC